MKKLLIFTTFLSFSLISFSQNRTLPKVELKTLDNNTFNTFDFDNDGKPIVISFWATWCKPCIKELNNIADGGTLESAHADLTAIGYSDDTVLFKLVEDKLRPILVAADIPPDKINLILNRIKLISEGAETSELPSANSIKQGLSREQKSALKDYISVAKAKNFIGVATAPVAKAISDFAIEVLRGLESFFVTDSEAEVERINEAEVRPGK